ncbi:wall-associated receptor kinase-like 1 [Salvia miltiorrhiza]|uniref:wall-associated receptor kinase-like 1 n=1 Tax=Salvia miltiorrhiza TaxID=226208 RepID=UPI0025ABA31C|nr:wall-associated receptor kinase-like 1 [Salvia miltiorrhiza]
MILQLCFLQYLISSFSWGAVIPKEGCPERCGDVAIPFPFGVGSECSLGEYFNITCNMSKPYLFSFDGLEVVEINPSQVRVRFKQVLNSACYNGSVAGNPTREGGSRTSYGYSFYNSPYVFSDDNWLTAIGCNHMLTTFTMDDAAFDHYQQTYGGSCASFCMNPNDSTTVCPPTDAPYPPGNACCFISIPKGMTQVSSELANLDRGVGPFGDGKVSSCSYAFLQEKVRPNESTVSYPLSFLNNSNEFLQDGWTWKNRVAPPVVRLDWRINGTRNCSQAKKTISSYACRDINSDCVDYNASVGGYLCRCNQGYIGNPYLPHGCRDFNECETNPCDSNSICVNTAGSFKCKCSKGYNGDGRKNGRGCIPSKLTNIFIGLSSGLGFFLLLSVCLLLRKVHQKRKKQLCKQKFFKQNGGLLLQQRTKQGAIGGNQLFPAKELEKATDNFNESRILGQGGQGIVYKGMLSDGKMVAIKKSKLVDKDQLHQFINEVVILSQINHRNVVKLLGCCLETEVPLLVYEFLPNGTLYNLIHDPRIEFPISWNMRLKMAADIAGALAYMHSTSSMPIYHRDIKSTNILLDEKYVVKVSDFGISRALALDLTHLTTRVKGTFGYFDPEYFQSNQYTEKSDVYSFGVVLVELLTGQKPVSLERDEEERSLVTRFLASIEDNYVDAILDPQVLEHDGKEEVSGVVLLAQRCLNLQGRMRPTMKQVATELECLRMSQMPAAIIHQSAETRPCEATKSTMISDFEYTWTASDSSEVPSSSDTYPLKSETV